MRLTTKYLESENYFADEISEDATEEERNEYLYSIIKKLGQLEDIEDELGIDLITLFKAETRGFYYKSKDGVIYWSGNQFVRVSGYFVKTEPCYQVKRATLKSCYSGDVENFVTLKDAHYWDWDTHEQVKISDYGKTWALTKEELESDK